MTLSIELLQYSLLRNHGFLSALGFFYLCELKLWDLLCYWTISNILFFTYNLETLIEQLYSQNWQCHRHFQLMTLIPGLEQVYIWEKILVLIAAIKALYIIERLRNNRLHPCIITFSYKSLIPWWVCYSVVYVSMCVQLDLSYVTYSWLTFLMFHIIFGYLDLNMIMLSHMRIKRMKFKFQFINDKYVCDCASFC